MANFVTFIRVFLAIVATTLITQNYYYNLIAISLIVIAMLLDAIDGYIARKRRTHSWRGAAYDILADRIIENLFFIYYANLQLFSVWIAIIMMIRGLSIDAVRSLFTSSSKTAFGSTSLHQLNWTKFLACSRLSRGTYNTLKLITFVLYGFMAQPDNVLTNYVSQVQIQQLAQFCLWSCVSIGLIRAIPVIYEEFAYLQLRHCEERSDEAIQKSHEKYSDCSKLRSSQ